MVIILEGKRMSQSTVPPPPPYQPRTHRQQLQSSQRHSTGNAAATHDNTVAKFENLPQNILLYVIHQCLFPRSQQLSSNEHEEYRRKVFYWMTVCLRLVNRVAYTACMHILRSTYLPSYLTMIKTPYSSDPFPLTDYTSIPAPTYNRYQIQGQKQSQSQSQLHLRNPIISIQRETQILDLFLAAKVREDVWTDDSELHLGREEAFQDLFDLMQPRARLEDLVRTYGAEIGVISVFIDSDREIDTTDRTQNNFHSGSDLNEGPGVYCGSNIILDHGSDEKGDNKNNTEERTSALAYRRQQDKRRRNPIPFQDLSCSFTPRSAGLIFTVSMMDSSTSPIQSSSSGLTSAVSPSSSSRAVSGVGARIRSLGRRSTPTPISPTTSSSNNQGTLSSVLVQAVWGNQPNTGTRTRRTIVEISRTRDEKLEDTARRLVNGLREWLDSN